MSDIAICVQRLTKDFDIYEKPLDVALELLTRKTRHKTFRALDNVSFEVQRGEVLGIIGHNGAGKSTLLKIITGVLDATGGTVDIAGRVTAILELGLGFNTELTGRDNIHLSGLLYGMTKREINQKLESIISFSGLGDFIERPVKTYSSGMQARLAFSVATSVEPDILIIDEALAAGDAMFVQKSLRRIHELCRGGRTVLVVSHGTSILAQLCQRVMWLDEGRVRSLGTAMNVIQAYDLAAHQGADSSSWIETVSHIEPRASSGSDRATVDAGRVPSTISDEAVTTATPAEIKVSSIISDEAATTAMPSEIDFAQIPVLRKNDVPADGRQVLRRGPIFIESVELLDGDGQRSGKFTCLMPWSVRVVYRCDGPIPPETLGVAMAINKDGDLTPVVQWFTHNIRPDESRETYASAPFRNSAYHRGIVELKFGSMPLLAGVYVLSLGLLPNVPGNWWFWEYRHFYYKFTVEDGGLGFGALIYLEPEFHHREAGNVPKLEVHDLPSLVDEAIDPQAPKPAIMPAADFHNRSEDFKTLREEVSTIYMRECGYPDQWPSHVVCPCCGMNALKPFFKKFGFNHSKCWNCDFVFLNPYPSDETLAKMYSGPYYTRVREFFERPNVLAAREGSPFSTDRATFEGVISKATNERDTGDWLDVGGGLGEFAVQATSSKPNWKITLNEFNPRSLQIARDELGLNVSSANPTELLAESKLYDVISAFSVLEHVPHPAKFVQLYSQLLSSGGVLVLVVPQLTKLAAQVAQSANPNVEPPFHVSLFNKDNLNTLLLQTNVFDRIEISGFGPPAFSLIQHVNYAEHWDITMPTASEPQPRSVMIKPYDVSTEERLNILGEANNRLGDFFAEVDGRVSLMAWAWKA